VYSQTKNSATSHLEAFIKKKHFYYIMSVFVVLFVCRHVKGRVLVALADGTVAIFHRASGKRSKFLANI